MRPLDGNFGSVLTLGFKRWDTGIAKGKATLTGLVIGSFTQKVTGSVLGEAFLLLFFPLKGLSSGSA